MRGASRSLAVRCARPIRWSSWIPSRIRSDSTRYEKDSGLSEAVVCGTGLIHGIRVSLAVMDFRFCGGSMGSAAGEKITRAIEMAAGREDPVHHLQRRGGARMQEGIFSLMQMAKTSAAFGRLAAARLPFISILTDPTTGGVTASFATLGDVILAEPGALIGFAGAVVIKETTKQTLPGGFPAGGVSAQARADRPDRQPAGDARPPARHPAGPAREEIACGGGEPVTGGRRKRRRDAGPRVCELPPLMLIARLSCDSRRQRFQPAEIAASAEAVPRSVHFIAVCEDSVEGGALSPPMS